MKSTLVSYQKLVRARRWDFEYFDPEYQTIIDGIESSGWKICKLGEIVTNLTDGQHGYLVHLPEGIPLLRTTNVFENEIRLDDVRYIAPEVHTAIKRSQLKPGDVLLTTIGSLGIAAIVDDSLGEANINQNLVKMTPKPEVNPLYLSLFLNSNFGKVQTQRTASKSVVPIINYSRLKDIVIPVPPRSLQDQIAQVIQEAYRDRQKKLQEAVNLLQGINELLLDELNIDLSLIHQESKFLVSSLELSRKWRVENHNIRGLLSVIENGHYPVVKLGEVANFVNKKHTSSQEFYYIEIGGIDIDSGLIQEDQLVKYTAKTAPNNAQRQVKQGDILISTRRPTRGAIAVVPKSLDNSICTLFFSILRLREDVAVVPEYIAAFLRTQVGRLQFQQAITETTYPVVSDSDVAELLLPLPPLKVQQTIVAKVQARISDSKLLRSQAETVVAAAKARVERMILGEETVE